MRVVTIDGPAGAGKSTVSKRLAERLGWRFLDTGAMYRAVALAALRAGVDLHDNEQLGRLAADLEVTLPPGQVLLNGEDVTEPIRTVEVTRSTRFVADSPAVRQRLVALQRAFARGQDTVTEGRDQGTVVFPDALCKFFLTASLEARAERRYAEFAQKGMTVDLATVLKDVHDRDASDASRSIAPMEPASDAEVVDTTGISLDDVLAHLESAIRARLGETERPS